MSIQDDLQSYLQDVSDVAGVLLGKLLQREAEVPETSISDVKKLLADLKDILPALTEACETWPAPRPMRQDSRPVYGVGFSGGRYAA